MEGGLQIASARTARLATCVEMTGSAGWTVRERADDGSRASRAAARHLPTDRDPDSNRALHGREDELVLRYTPQLG